MRLGLMPLVAATLLIPACFSEPEPVENSASATTSSDATSTRDGSDSSNGSSDDTTGSSGSTGRSSTVNPTSQTGGNDTTDSSDTESDSSGPPPEPELCGCPPAAEFCAGFEKFDSRSSTTPFEGWNFTPSSGPITQTEGRCDEFAVSASIAAGDGNTLGSQISREQLYAVGKRGGFVFGGWVRFSDECFDNTLRVADVLASSEVGSMNYRIELILADDRLRARYTANPPTPTDNMASLLAPAPGTWERFSIELRPADDVAAPAMMTFRVGDESFEEELQLPASGPGSSISSLLGVYDASQVATCSAQYDGVYLTETAPI